MARKPKVEMSEHPGYGQDSTVPGKRRHRVGIFLAAFLAIVLVGGAVAAWAYDDSKADEIPAGISIGGVDVGGLTTDQARQKLNTELVEPLRRPIRVTHDDKTWTLAAKELAVRGSIRSAVEEAVEAGQDTGLPSRIWRYVSGGSIDKEITPDLNYSKKAVNDFVRQVAADLNRNPVDASVAATGSSLEVVQAEPGLALRDRLLTEKIETAAADASVSRRIPAKTIKTDPEVTTKTVAEKYPVYLTLDRSSFQLKLWKDLKLVKTYTVAVGAIGLDTPAGLYSIQNKAVDPAWHVPNSDWAGDLAGQVIPGGVPENPLKARWLGIYAGAGIHGTSETGSLGSAASHGCVRMDVPDVIELYDQVPVGTPIYIA